MQQSQGAFQFGGYELNPNRRELRKRGVKIKLQDQPLQILLLLLERPGEVVTREQIQRRLWPEDTHVDFDNAINSAIRKLRDALGDSAENPRFVETLARRGYRFVAPVSRLTNGAGRLDAGGAESDLFAPLPRGLSEQPKKRSRWLWTAGALVTVLVGMGLALRWEALRPDRAGDGTSPAPTPLTSYPGFEQFPTFSPDGSRVAFSWDEPGKRPSNIYVKLIGPGDPIRLSTNAKGDFAPAWSPDGRSIAFLRARDPLHASVMVMTAVGGQERELADIGFDTENIFFHYSWEVPPPFLTWANDGRWLLTVAQTGAGFGRAHAIVRISLDIGEKVVLTSPGNINGDGSLALSPDNKSLAFTRTTSTHVSDIFIAPLGSDLQFSGKPERLTIDSAEIGGLAWAPDGRSLIFSSRRGSGRLELWRIAPHGFSKPVLLTGAGEDPVDLAVSQETRRVVYQHKVGGMNIWRVALKGNQAGQAVSFLPSTRLQGHPKYSSDGQRIAFESNRSGNEEIWTCNADGTNTVQLTWSGKARSGSPRWSPDGKRIAFDSDVAGRWEIYVINSQGGKPVRLTSGPANDAKPSWSHDGKWIYFSSNRTGASEIWKISAVGGEPVQVTRHGGFAAFESPDGKTLYLEKGLGLGLWSLSTQGTDEIRISESMYLRNFAPVSNGVYFIDRASHLNFFDWKTGRTKMMIAVPGVMGAEMSISPDERWMLYETSVRASELMLVENFH